MRVSVVESRQNHVGLAGESWSWAVGRCGRQKGSCQGWSRTGAERNNELVWSMETESWNQNNDVDWLARLFKGPVLCSGLSQAYMERLMSCRNDHSPPQVCSLRWLSSGLHLPAVHKHTSLTPTWGRREKGGEGEKTWKSCHYMKLEVVGMAKKIFIWWDKLKQQKW